MADVIVTLKIMPESTSADLKKIEMLAKKKIEKLGSIGKTEILPVAFGLKAINIVFIMDEKKGDTEKLEKEIELIEGVGSVEVTDVRRAIG